MVPGVIYSGMTTFFPFYTFSSWPYIPYTRYVLRPNQHDFGS